MTESELLEVAGRLEASMDNLAGEVAAQANEVARQDAYGHRNRQLIWGLVVSFLFSVAMGGVAISASLRATEATSQARRNQENARISCQVGNEGRKLQVDLWMSVLAQSERNPNLTAFQRKQIVAFRAQLTTVYAPRDCDGNPATPLVTVAPTR